MERQNDGHSVGLQDARQHTVHRELHMFQFIIDGDSQCLKHSRGRVLSSAAGRRRNNAADAVVELFGGFDGRLPPLVDDVCGDLAGKRFFSKLRKDFFELCGRQGSQQLSRRFAPPCMKPHVERGGCIKSKSTLSVCQLIGRQTQIEQDAVDLLQTAVGEVFRSIDIRRLKQMGIRLVEFFRRIFQHHGVPIDSDQATRGADPLQNLLTVSARSDCSIHNSQAFGQLQVMQHFPGHDRHMNRLSGHSNGVQDERDGGGRQVEGNPAATRKLSMRLEPG